MIEDEDGYNMIDVWAEKDKVVVLCGAKDDGYRQGYINLTKKQASELIAEILGVLWFDLEVAK